MKIKEKLEKEAELRKELRNLQNQAENEKRDLSSDEKKKADKILSDLESIQSDIERDNRSKNVFAKERLERAIKNGETDKLDVPEKDIKRFSILRAIDKLSRQQPLDGVEKELSDEVAKRTGKDAQGFYVPYDVLTYERRDLDVGSTAGDLISTDKLSGSFIDMLRNKALIRQMGAQYLNGLVGDVSIPKQTGGATAYWVTEGNAPTESNQTVGQVSMSPSTVGAYTDISRKLIKQSSVDAEQFVRNDLATVLALEIDRAAINGSGSGAEPEGIITGISATTSGSSFAAGDEIDLWAAVAAANADIGKLGFLTNATLAAILMGTSKDSGSGRFVMNDETRKIMGYNTGISNQVPSDLGTGDDESALLFGNFADLIIGTWGGLDILVDPYTGGTAGTVRVVAMQEVDIARRHDDSFAYSTFTG